MDGADIDAISDAQWFSIEAAYREGWPLVLLQPTREQIDTVIANLRIHLDPPEEIDGLDAIGFQRTGVGDTEAVFEYVDTDSAPDPDVRVADWRVGGGKPGPGRAAVGRRFQSPRASRRRAGVGIREGGDPTGIADR